MEFGEPHATTDAIFRIVDEENSQPRIVLGTKGLVVVRSAYAARIAAWEAWEAASVAAQGGSKAHEIASLYAGFRCYGTVPM
jgi:hypothetical protein